MEVTAARGGTNGEPLARADTGAGDAGAPTGTGAPPTTALRISPSHRRAYTTLS